MFCVLLWVIVHAWLALSRDVAQSKALRLRRFAPRLRPTRKCLERVERAHLCVQMAFGRASDAHRRAHLYAQLITYAQKLDGNAWKVWNARWLQQRHTTYLESHMKRGLTLMHFNDDACVFSTWANHKELEK